LNIYSKKRTWKLLLLISAFLIGIISLWYTNTLVKELSEEERKKVELWAEGTKKLINIQDPNQDFSFIVKVITNNVTIPVILVDEKDSIINARNLDSTKMEKPKYAMRQLEKMKEENEPFEITLSNGHKNYIYYEHSTLLTKLYYYPFIQLGVIFLFIIVSYLAFSTSRKAEQNQVWVGMSKETAHQLGTPISSLMAWLELLKQQDTDQSIILEVEKDIERLSTITERFSKIGSVPNLKLENLTEIIDQSVDYFKKRTSGQIEFISSINGTDFSVPMNPALFQWVIENLFKNAIDAMSGSGKIEVHVSENSKGISIDIKDYGKGIQKSKQKAVFQPGFTTKARGWGLGLSLSKRIIEEYHQGKIFVKQSDPGKGTTFRIQLNK